MTAYSDPTRPVPASEKIRAALAENTLAFNKAREDADLYKRLQNAHKDAARLASEATDLTEKLNDALADDAKAERDALFAQFGGITVEHHFPAERPEGVMNARWIITYRRLAWDSNLHQSVMTDFRVADFDRLPPEAMRYLLEAAPEKLPAIISDLAPGDPAAAMARYFLIKGRGWM